METLDELRNQIDSIDQTLADLMNQRMNVSRKVAEYKSQNHSPIFHADREEQIIQNFLKNFETDRACLARSVYQSFIRSSRALQYQYQAERGIDSAMVSLLKNAPHTAESVNTVCYQGVPGAWSHSAAKKIYPGKETVSVLSFEEIFTAIKEGRAQAGVLPLDNTTAGAVDDVYDLLIKYDCMIQTAKSYPIHHCLLATPGATKDTIKTVYSHPQGLAQCISYIQSNGFSSCAETNTAVAAKKISEKQDETIAAIASRETAELYGLCVLEENINDSKCNQTRFVSIARHCTVSEDANRISLAFRLPNQSGALANILGLFSDYGINLLKISSRPIPNQPWEYCFYLDCAIEQLDRNICGLLNQLNAELGWIKLLGCYCEKN